MTTNLTIKASASHDFPWDPAYDLPNAYVGQRRQRLTRLTAHADLIDGVVSEVRYASRTAYPLKSGANGGQASYPSHRQAMEVAGPEVLEALAQQVRDTLARVTVTP